MTSRAGCGPVLLRLQDLGSLINCKLLSQAVLILIHAANISARFDLTCNPESKPPTSNLNRTLETCEPQSAGIPGCSLSPSSGGMCCLVEVLLPFYMVCSCTESCILVQGGWACRSRGYYRPQPEVEISFLSWYTPCCSCEELLSSFVHLLCQFAEYGAGVLPGRPGYRSTSCSRRRAINFNWDAPTRADSWQAKSTTSNVNCDKSKKFWKIKN